ncbi:uroporphyrinogen-III synthase [Deminuibacter soli]|uniref:Uroporphyrinogen-III synthase n=1 Tax=Deminuibacter soli TaxID=2291815 RepID=A0A3E1NP90_9BACT|nr:uroporphyrinogen-III synthase [Deminuibacter soli]RFM29733.1 uroporphyrinogen-III synthase [Deminuibacter soli]
MPQSKVNILCTRALDMQLVQKAAHKNIGIDVTTFIETIPVRTEEVATLVQQYSLQNIVVVFTSMSAVEAVIMQLNIKPNWQIFCMGGVTKDLVIDFFGNAAIIGTARNATVLAEKIASHEHIKKVVFFCGEQRLDDLPELLHHHQIEVVETVVYMTLQTPQLIEKNYDAVIFFSPSAVHSFFSMNTIPITVVLFAIGKTTAATIQTYCTNKVVISEWPGREQMIDLAIQYFTQQ